MLGIYKSEKIQANLDLKDKGGNKDVYQFFGSNLWVQIFLNMKEHQKKGALKQKIEASLYTLDRGFKKISFTLHTHVLAYKMVQSLGIQKLVSKITGI